MFLRHCEEQGEETIWESDETAGSAWNGREIELLVVTVLAQEV